MITSVYCIPQWRKVNSQTVFVPTNLQNLLVTGVYGERVRERERAGEREGGEGGRRGREGVVTSYYYYFIDDSIDGKVSDEVQSQYQYVN